MRFVSFGIFVYCFCIVLGFQAFCILLCFHAFRVFQDFCILLLYRASFSRFLYDAFVSCYVFMLFVFDHDGPSLSSDSQLRNWTAFSSQILINSILVCTILWVEHNGHRRIQILFPSHPSSYVRDLDFLGFILCLESVAAAEAFVTSTLAFMYQRLLYVPRFTILLNPLLSLSSLR